ncbi:hypothetical protein D3C75_547890 [compost metagenome]
MNKGGRETSVKHHKVLSSHVAAYYTHLMNSVDTGCQMTDYCIKDIYVYDIMRNL